MEAFVLFFFALFVPRAKKAGVWAGAVCGVVVAAVIAFSGPLVYFLHTHWDVDPAIFNSAIIEKEDEATGKTWLTAEDPISFQWIGPTALLVNILVGTVVSLLLPERKED